jgi:hypothetical protein
MTTNTNFEKWVFQEIGTKKFLTLYGMNISFTNDIQFAKVFNSEYEAAIFEDQYANEFDEYTTIIKL